MKLHRFYVGDSVELTRKTWLHDEKILWQWRKVLRFEVGREVVLFDGKGTDRLYRLTKLADNEAGLELVTELEPVRPRHEVYLLWGLLKKDKNDWVVQKCTELGVSHFVPLLADRSEKLGFNTERARKICIEAAEQCGRSDVPQVREPIGVAAAIEQYANRVTTVVCEQSRGSALGRDDRSGNDEPTALLVGPEGGWSERERQLFAEKQLSYRSVARFTLRAETACVAAVTLQNGTPSMNSELISK